MRRPGDMSFPAIERRSVQYFRFHLSDSPLSKVQAYFEILLRVLVEDDNCHFTGGQRSGIGSRIDSRRLELFGEVTLEKGCSAECPSEFEAVRHRLHHVF